jgi:hypothetical protein
MLRDGLLFQVERSTTGGVEISVHPDKGLSRVLFVWRRESACGRLLRPYVGKSREESPREKKKAEMNLGSAGLTACATIQ